MLCLLSCVAASVSAVCVGWRDRRNEQDINILNVRSASHRGYWLQMHRGGAAELNPCPCKPSLFMFKSQRYINTTSPRNKGNVGSRPTIFTVKEPVYRHVCLGMLWCCRISTRKTNFMRGGEQSLWTLEDETKHPPSTGLVWKLHGVFYRSIGGEEANNPG